MAGDQLLHQILHMHIQSGVQLFREFCRKRVEQKLTEMGRLKIQPVLVDVQGRGQGHGIATGVDAAVGEQTLQHHSLAFLGKVQSATGIIAAGRLRQASQQAGFGERELGRRFVEIAAACCLHPVYLIGERHAVEVLLEDLAFAQLTLDAHSQSHLPGFDIPAPGQSVHLANQLLCDGGTA
ncbi:MAG: hypothetical protein BWY83_01914 [bacterium ADurb.Bin478]|nr:MAG: hypothetical protein BWY83_01914 [bacterium ADurb.Bin478]